MAQTIRPQAFDRFSSPVYRRSPLYSEWDPAVLKVVAELLVGHRVVVEVDAHTGHAVEGVVVGWKNQTAHSIYPHLTLSDGHGLTNYRVSSIGVIMDLDNSDARWDADRELGERGDRAIAAVRTFLGAEWVVLDGEALVWRATHRLDGSVTVQALHTRGVRRDLPTLWTWTVAPDGAVKQGAMATRDLERGHLTLR